MIPVSSRVSKYMRIYNSEIQTNKKCDTIVFGNVLGCKKAFLIQNMCPITSDYVKMNTLIHTIYPLESVNYWKQN